MLNPSPAALYGGHFDAVLQRHHRALKAQGFRGLLIHSGSPPIAFLDDNAYPFRVNPPFKAWLPLTDVPDCFLYFERGRRPLLLFHNPADYWHKPAAVPDACWTSFFEVIPVDGRKAARAALPADLSGIAYIGEAIPELAAWRLQDINPRPLLTRLDFERATKTPYELACLREATRLGVKGHRAAYEAFADGGSEFEIAQSFLRAAGQREQELPYNPIVALNEGAAVLHYQMLGRSAPASRHSLLIDAGCEFAGYSSDITRTYSASEGDFATLVDEMDEVQQALCASVRAGVDWRDIHLLAHRLVAELLHASDIIRCDADEAIESGLSSVFLPHGLGHLLGLQVHDVGGLLQSPEGGEIPRPAGHPYLRLTRVLEEGFVVTMEPGLYFIDQLLSEARADRRGSQINWARVDQFRPFGGIRIEDDLAVTATGCENLTRDAFEAATARTD